MALVVLPAHLGHVGVGVGAGPDHLLRAGAVEALGAEGAIRVGVPAVGELGELAACFELLGAVAAVLSSDPEEVDVVLAGNCLASVAVARDADRVLWFDAHADLMTPRTTTTGFVDGWSAAVLVGEALPALAPRHLAGFAPTALERLRYAGPRDVEDAERPLLERAEVVGDASSPDSLLGGLDGRVHVHLDLDCLHARYGAVNAVAPLTPGGLEPEPIVAAIAALREQRRLASLSITAFDPTCPAVDAATSLALDALRAAR